MVEFAIAMAVFVALCAIAMVVIYYDHKDKSEDKKKCRK